MAKVLPQCWGHRGASSAFPENTLASFEAAIRDGSEGIESDVHVSADNVIIMFHDPTLDRTTNGHGNIKDQNWYGEDGMQHLKTKKLPAQSIPTFTEAIDFLMKPENQHIIFNIDIKPHNDPTRLFTLMYATLSTYPDWRTKLAPRLVLGLWHPKFIQPAKKLLPECTRGYIGFDLFYCREYFWEHVDVLSVWFGALVGAAGQAFRKDVKAAGKKLTVWTVNDPDCMAEIVRWGADAILTDVPLTYLAIRAGLKIDYNTILARFGRLFLWTTWSYYEPVQIVGRFLVRRRLAGIAGPFEKVGDKSEELSPIDTDEAK